MPNNFFQTQPLGENFGVSDYYRQVQANISQGLLDPQSQFYQQFRSFLGSATPSPGANSFLSLLQAGGGNIGASQVQAQQMQRGAEGRSITSIITEQITYRRGGKTPPLQKSHAIVTAVSGRTPAHQAVL